MDAITLGGLLLALAVAGAWRFGRRFLRMRLRRRRRRQHSRHGAAAPAPGWPAKKPEWVRREVLALHERLGLSHRKLADLFNATFFAATGLSVGRTWVRDLLMRQAYEALHRQQTFKHRMPPPLPPNLIWGIDTTCVGDGQTLHTVLGIVDHGSRLNVALCHLARFNVWTLLGHLFLAFGRYGKPAAVRLDNHPVHHAQWFKRILRLAGVRLRYTQLASPWQNGRIERFFGTLKQALLGYVVRDARHLIQALGEFRFWYNAARPHQHLGGRTPEQAWHAVDPFRQPPRLAQVFSAWEGRLRGVVLRH